MFPSRCIHDPCRNMEVITWEIWRPGSVTHTRFSPIGKPAPGGTARVSSPGINPRLQTDAATATSTPAPWTAIHTTTQIAMMAIVPTGVRCVSFSSW